MKKLIALLLALGLACCMCACSQSGSTRTYTVEACKDSETVNQWKTVCLVDADHYLITVYAVDGWDNTKVRADFYMAGEYVTNEDGTVTIAPGYGYVYALNGETPIEFPISPDENGDFAAVYYSVIGGEYDTFMLNSDGTWTGIEE